MRKHVYNNNTVNWSSRLTFATNIVVFFSLSSSKLMDSFSSRSRLHRFPSTYIWRKGNAVNLVSRESSILMLFSERTMFAICKNVQISVDLSSLELLSWISQKWPSINQKIQFHLHKCSAWNGQRDFVLWNYSPQIPSKPNCACGCQYNATVGCSFVFEFQSLHAAHSRGKSRAKILLLPPLRITGNPYIFFQLIR